MERLRTNVTYSSECTCPKAFRHITSFILLHTIDAALPTGTSVTTVTAVSLSVTHLEDLALELILGEVEGLVDLQRVHVNRKFFFLLFVQLLYSYVGAALVRLICC